MSSLNKLFSNAQRTWTASIGLALVIEGSIFAFLSLGFFGFIAAFRGADNPLWYFIAFVLQFPSTLAFIPALRLARYFATSESGAFLSAGIAVAVLQFAILSLCFRKPWRRPFVGQTSV